MWLPNSDFRTFKRRTALVVQADALQTGLPQVVAAMITSNLARCDHPSRVFIPVQSAAAPSAGLRTDSVIMTDNLATILHQAVAHVLKEILDPADATLFATRFLDRFEPSELSCRREPGLLPRDYLHRRSGDLIIDDGLEETRLAARWPAV